MLNKYWKEILSLIIGFSVLFLAVGASQLAKKESEKAKEIRKKEMRQLQEQMSKPLEEVDNSEKALKIVKVKEFVPEKFSSYIVSVRIDLKNSTNTVEAIENIRKACSIIGSAPTVLNTEVIGVQGRVCNKEGQDQIFDLELIDANGE